MSFSVADFDIDPKLFMSMNSQDHPGIDNECNCPAKNDLRVLCIDKCHILEHAFIYLFHIRSIINSCHLGIYFYISRISYYNQIMIIMDHGFAIRNI